jgi:hypothetical protein
MSGALIAGHSAVLAGHSALLADTDQGKGSPIGLFVVIVLVIAVYFLYRSMSRHIKKVPPTFDPPADPPADPPVDQPADQPEDLPAGPPVDPPAAKA